MQRLRCLQPAHAALAGAMGAPHLPLVTACAGARHMAYLSKQARARVDANEDLKYVMDEFSVPGKFHKFLMPSRRQMKRDARMNDSEAAQRRGWDAELMAPAVAAATAVRRGDGRPPSKRLAKRVARALNDILYDPAFGMGATEGGDGDAGVATPPAWRVDKIHVATNGNANVWWVPADEERAKFLLDNDAMVAELGLLARSVKDSLRHKLKLKKSEMPKVVFHRRDLHVDLLLEMVENEMAGGPRMDDGDADLTDSFAQDDGASGRPRLTAAAVDLDSAVPEVPELNIFASSEDTAMRGPELGENSEVLVWPTSRQAKDVTFMSQSEEMEDQLLDRLALDDDPHKVQKSESPALPFIDLHSQSPSYRTSTKRRR